MDIRELGNLLKMKSKGAHVSIMSESDIFGINEWIPTPSFDLNRILGGGLYKGIPSKTFSLFIGPEATGKSSFMCLCLAEAQRMGYKPIVIDTEGAWTADFVKRWDLDPDNMLIIYTPWVDEITTTLGEIISNNVDKIALVIDSIGGLERKKVLTDIESGGIAKADQGALQKEIKRMLKMVVNIAKGKNSMALASAHYYGDPSAGYTYGNTDKIGGGYYMRLAPDIIVALKKNRLYENNKGKSIKEKGNIIGNNISACTLKNRLYPPFQEAKIEIDYKNGINKYAGILDLLIKSGNIKLGGAWYTLPNNEKIQGAIKVEEYISNNPEILKILDDWLLKTGYSTTNNEIKEANELLNK